jgi:hypothetical protein
MQKFPNLWRNALMKYTYWELTLFGDPAIRFYIPDVQVPSLEGKPEGETLWAPNLETTYTFNIGSGENLQYKFTWGDGGRSEWLTPDDNNIVEASNKWNKENYEYNNLIRVKARTQAGIESPWSDGLKIRITNTDPYIKITRPLEKHKYKNNEDMGYDKEIERCIIVGWVNVTVIAKGFSSTVKKVEFYLDETLKVTDGDEPYYWELNEDSYGYHTIKAVVYTETDEKNSDSIKIEIQKGKTKSFLSLFSRFDFLRVILEKIGFRYY